MIVVNFFIGLIIIVIGVLIVRYNDKVTHMFPKSAWLERNVGMGASFGLYYLLGFLVIIWGFLMMTSMHDNFLDAVFGPLVDSL